MTSPILARHVVNGEVRWHYLHPETLQHFTAPAIPDPPIPSPPVSVGFMAPYAPAGQPSGVSAGAAWVLPAALVPALGAGYDDSTAINWALANYRDVRLIPGLTYTTYNPITPPLLSSLLCESLPWTDPQANYGVGGIALGGAVIQPAASFTGTAVIDLGKSGAAQAGGQYLRGFSIDGTNLPASVHGISAASAGAVVLRNLVVDKVTGNGLNAQGTTPDFTPPNGWLITECKFTNNGGWGMNCIGMADTWWVNGLCSNNGSGGANISNPADARAIGWRCNNNANAPGWSLVGNTGYNGKMHLIATDANFNGTGYAISGSGTGEFAIIGTSHSNTTASFSYAGTNSLLTPAAWNTSTVAPTFT